jgi:hypothetical protein
MFFFPPAPGPDRFIMLLLLSPSPVSQPDSLCVRVHRRGHVFVQDARAHEYCVHYLDGNSCCGDAARVIPNASDQSSPRVPSLKKHFTVKLSLLCLRVQATRAWTMHGHFSSPCTYARDGRGEHTVRTFKIVIRLRSCVKRMSCNAVYIDDATGSCFKRGGGPKM